MGAVVEEAMEQGDAGLASRDIVQAQTPHLQNLLGIFSKDLLSLHRADTNLKDTREALNLFNGSVPQLTLAVKGR
ncbi:MAG: hypothetical protein AB7P17_11270 [Nitrospirales bacterium]|nr:hypothetical protein [Nitrospirales bacterium]